MGHRAPSYRQGSTCTAQERPRAISQTCLPRTHHSRSKRALPFHSLSSNTSLSAHPDKLQDGPASPGVRGPNPWYPRQVLPAAAVAATAHLGRRSSMRAQPGLDSLHQAQWTAAAAETMRAQARLQPQDPTMAAALQQEVEQLPDGWLVVPYTPPQLALRASHWLELQHVLEREKGCSGGDSPYGARGKDGGKIGLSMQTPELVPSGRPASTAPTQAREQPPLTHGSGQAFGSIGQYVSPETQLSRARQQAATRLSEPQAGLPLPQPGLFTP